MVLEHLLNLHVKLCKFLAFLRHFISFNCSTIPNILCNNLFFKWLWENHFKLSQKQQNSVATINLQPWPRMTLRHNFALMKCGCSCVLECSFGVNLIQNGNGKMHKNHISKLLEVIAHEEPSLRKNSSYEGMNNHSIRISHSWRCRTCSYFMVRDYDPIRSLIHCFKCIVIVIQIILSLFSTYRLRDRLITGNCVVNSKKGLDFRTWK